MPDQKPMWTRCLGEFSVMWVTELMISQVKKRIFCPKTTKFGPKLAFLVDMGQAMQAYSVPCWCVGWWLWRAGCISQDTYLLYIWDVVSYKIFLKLQTRPVDRANAGHKGKDLIGEQQRQHARHHIATFWCLRGFQKAMLLLFSFN